MPATRTATAATCYPDDPGGSLAWLASAAGALGGPLPCQQENPHLWFSEVPADLDLAKARCRPCPLRAACLAGALERGEPHGVWGGEILFRGSVTAYKRLRGRPPRRRKLQAGSPSERR